MTVESSTQRLARLAALQGGLSDFQVSSENQNRLFAMMIPSSNKLYGFSTYASKLNQGIEQMSSL
jgi:hypothetical protein